MAPFLNTLFPHFYPIKKTTSCQEESRFFVEKYYLMSKILQVNIPEGR